MNQRFESAQMTVSGPPTYFTVWTTAEGGFTDKLSQFSAFYRLGRSLRYQYWHSPLLSQRSSSCAFDFVGLNAHLAEFALPPFQRFCYLDIRITKKLIERNKIGSFDRLQQYVRASVANAQMTHPNDNLVVRFGISDHGRNIYPIINRDWQDMPDELNCLDIYRQARAREPRASQFQAKKTRVLVHMRQGDTGVIETPWHTFISTWWQAGDEYLQEFDSYAQLCALHIEVDNFYDFMQAFQSQYPDELSIVFCSDGYGATFDHLFRNRDRLNLDERRLETLREMSQSYDEQKFRRFDQFAGSVAQIGETDENFCDLVNSIIEADIIVTGTQQVMIVQFLARFYDLHKPKIVVILHRDGRIPDREYHDLSERKAILVPVDLRNYNIAQVCEVVQSEVANKVVASKLADLAPIFSGGTKEARSNQDRREVLPQKRFDQFKYLSVDDLWIICCLFNAANYKSMPRKYALFEKSLKDSGLRFITVECAFDGQPFSLKPSENIVQVRSNSVLWQKERLLNLALSRLPQQCKKVAWLDTDIFFLNGGWAKEASQLLEEYPVVQLFERGALMPPGAECYTGEKGTLKGFAYVLNEEKESFNQDLYGEHGHTGYGWAFRREILEKHGLYDRLIVGSADHATAHTMIGNFSSACLDRDLGRDPRQIEPFREWAQSFHEQIRSKVGYVSGTVVHKWHGTLENKHHGVRHDRLRECGFDPSTDLRLNGEGCWEWNTDKPQLHSFLRQYFASRCEDG